MGQGKVWEVPGESNLIKVAEVILVGFPGIKDSAVLQYFRGRPTGSVNLASLQGSV